MGDELFQCPTCGAVHIGEDHQCPTEARKARRHRKAKKDAATQEAASERFSRRLANGTRLHHAADLDARDDVDREE